MSYFGGVIVGAIAVMLLVAMPIGMVIGSHERKRRPKDWIIDYSWSLLWTVVFTIAARVLWPGTPRFLDGVLFGIATVPIAFLPDVVYTIRHRRDPETAEMSAPAPKSEHFRRFGVPVAGFGADVEAHFADPVVRGRYLIAAYRRGLIPGADLPRAVAGLGDLGPGWAHLASADAASVGEAIERAAADIGYDRTPQQADADVAEQLIHYALRTGDVRRHREALSALDPTAELHPIVRDEPEWLARDRRDKLRENLIDELDARYGPQLSDSVHTHFADPTVRAHDLIVSYRVHVTPSRAVPQRAAELIADLPGAGEAWTELAMAAPTSARSELEPILDRAADEIGYRRTPAEAERDLYEAAAYRAVVETGVREEARLLWELSMRDDVFLEGDIDPALRGLHDAHAAAGDDYDTQIRDTRHTQIDYLNDRYE